MKFVGSTGAAMLGTAAAVVLSVGWTAQLSAKELIFNSYLPKRSSMYKGAIASFSNRLAKESGGVLAITVPPATLGPQWKQWQLVTSGVADIAIVPNHSQRQRLVLPEMANQPLLTKSAKAASQALWKTQHKYFDPFSEYKGVKLFGFCVLTARDLSNSKRPLRKVSDIEGLKIWSGLTQKAQVEGLGAVNVSVPFPKVFEVVSKGTVDGMIGSPSTLLSTRTAKYMKFMTHLPGGIGTGIFSLTMNLDSWNGLAAKEKAAFDRAAEGMSGICGTAMDTAEQGARKAIQKMGVKIVEPTPEFIAEVRQKLAFIKQHWIDAATKRGLANPQEALDYYTAEMDRLAM